MSLVQTTRAPPKEPTAPPRGLTPQFENLWFIHCRCITPYNMIPFMFSLIYGKHVDSMFRKLNNTSQIFYGELIHRYGISGIPPTRKDG
jgi:hypothetical protein